MSLLTPPNTSHRDKENRFTAPGSRVVWSAQNRYHNLASPPRVHITNSAKKELPARSILKKCSHVLFPTQGDKQREITPEPSDPLVNLDYLEFPVSRIINPDASLGELIEGYSVLAARLRSCVTGSNDVDASWPFFQPLRRNSDLFVEAVVRDLGRALVDPGSVEEPEPEAPCDVEKLLPSPKSTPKKKKKGMTAEQVKYARDLCTTCHAVIKVLAVVFTLPAVHSIFSDIQLRAILTEVLAIPLADDLPTPNARKTCALSIWLIQAQRLPVEVLVPARDRIAYALRRGLDGELGKEGKKGSASDGLKAIHDLCVYQPSTFVPAFIDLLPSILSNLLAPTLALRTQACHALGGFVIGCTSIPQSYLHTRISSHVATYLTTMPPVNKNASPVKTSPDPPIVRTLRTTLGATEPLHVAQGPVWALSVIASLVVLLGPALCSDVKLTRVISALLALSMQHKKSSVRALGCLMWRCVSWVYFQPALPGDEDGESEVDQEQGNSPIRAKQAAVRETYWKLVKSVVDLSAGVATIAGLVGDESNGDDGLRRTLVLLKLMIVKGGQTCSDAIETVKRLVSLETSDTEWNTSKLIPHSLFSAIPGLLTVEFKGLVHAVRPIFDQTPTFEDIRSLTREEISKDWVFEGLVEIWRDALGCLEMFDEAETPVEIVAVWDGLLKANIGLLQDAGDDAGTSDFTVRAVDILVDILQDPNFDLTPKSGSILLRATSPVAGSDGPEVNVGGTIECSNGVLKLRVIRDLWAKTRTNVPHRQLYAAAERLLRCFVKNEDDFTDCGRGARAAWASLCADALLVCDVDDLKLFWGFACSGDKGWNWNWSGDVRSVVWKSFIEKWTEDGEGTWEGAVVLLGVPFIDVNAWDLTADDFGMWEGFLCQTISKALDYGVDSVTVLDNVASTISQNQSPTFSSSPRVADLLMSHLDMVDARDIPGAVIEFVNETLRSSYPPEPRNTTTCMWAARTLTRVLDSCPPELFLGLLENLQEGLCLWISDEYQAWNEREFTNDIMPLYQTILLNVRQLLPNVEALENVSPVLESIFSGRADKPADALEAFDEFWQSTYSKVSPPEGGWPERMQHFLGLSPVDEEPAHVDSRESSPDQLMEDLVIGGPENPSRSVSITGSAEEPTAPFKVLGPVFFAPTLTAPMREAKAFEAAADSEDDLPLIYLLPNRASTPVTLSSRPSTPPRPQKPSVAFLQELPLLSPTSPIAAPHRAPRTPKRTPLGRSRNVSGGSVPSSLNRKKLQDKENDSLPPAITSVIERVAPSPGLVGPFILGKRPMSEELVDERPLKKSRMDAQPLVTIDQPSRGADVDIDIEEELFVESCLVADALFPTSEVSSAASEVSTVLTHPPPPKKRKRLFLDAVEVPTLQEVYQRLRSKASAGSLIAPQPFSTPSTKGRSLRQARSATFKIERPEIGTTRKRRRNSDSFAEDPFSSPSPLETLRDPRSDDSIVTLKAPYSPGRAMELSSDDDPHIGQVTPHHLISPALRRARSLGRDPPSDDSTLCESPSRDLVTRRLQRAASLQLQSPMPLVPLKL